MKTVWKWVIGIVVVLVVVSALVAGAFVMRSHMFNVVGVARLTRPGVQVPGNGKLPFNNNDGQRVGPGWMMPNGNDGWGRRGMGMRGPGMMGYGRMNPLGGLIGGLFSLGLLAVLVLGIIWLVRNLRKPAVAATPAAAVAPVVSTHPCPKCGNTVQDEWNNCPHCGKKL